MDYAESTATLPRPEDYADPMLVSTDSNPGRERGYTTESGTSDENTYDAGVEDTYDAAVDEATPTVDNRGVSESGATVEAIIEIHGVPFVVKKKGERVFLKHNKYSLSGRGATLAEAETKLYESAKILAQVYLERPADEMTAGGLEMRDLILKFIS